MRYCPVKIKIIKLKYLTLLVMTIEHIYVSKVNVFNSIEKTHLKTTYLGCTECHRSVVIANLKVVWLGDTLISVEVELRHPHCYYSQFNVVIVVVIVVLLLLMIIWFFCTLLWQNVQHFKAMLLFSFLPFILILFLGFILCLFKCVLALSAARSA